MIIGHLPAGYIFTKLLACKINNSLNPRFFILAGLTGAIAPDFDMIYFHLIDNRQHHHHSYWSHYPITWLALLLFFMVWFYFTKKRSTAILGLVFSVNGFIHMLLDTIVGDMRWFAPFMDKPFSIFTVPAIYNPWWLNFILHGSFMFEIFILFWAVILWYRNLRKGDEIISR